MKLRLLLLNVRGLNASEAMENLRRYIQGIHLCFNMIFLQEHKLRLGQYHAIAKKMWHEATVHCLDATPGYNHNQFDQGAGKGGVMALLAPRWSHVISHQGSILVNRAHYFALLGLHGGTIDFINVLCSK